jgi:phosphotransferase system HPr (HPr) family protein
VEGPDVISERVAIVNSRGLHARPCHSIVRLALDFEGQVEVVCEGRSANGKSILELMTLSAGMGTVLEFRARGAGAQAVVRSFVGLVQAGFQETD